MSKNVSLDEMKQEAIARMRDLKLWIQCVRRFDQKVPVETGGVAETLAADDSSKTSDKKDKN